MKQQKYLKLNIPEPCNESIENMDATSCGMFCHSCQKEVTDFTSFTDTEITDWLKKHTGGCGIFLSEQLNKPIPVYEVRTDKRSPYRLWAGIASIVTFFSVKDVQAQDTTKVRYLPGSIVKPSTITSDQIPKIICYGAESLNTKDVKTNYDTSDEAKRKFIAALASGEYTTGRFSIDATDEKKPSFFRRAWNFITGR